jgi:hypothetical protein
VKFRRAQTPLGVMADLYRVAWNVGLGHGAGNGKVRSLSKAQS